MPKKVWNERNYIQEVHRQFLPKRAKKKKEKSKKCFFLKLPINREGIEPKSYCDLY